MPTNDILIEYIRKYLIDIINEENIGCSLIIFNHQFTDENIINEFLKIKGYISWNRIKNLYPKIYQQYSKYISHSIWYEYQLNVKNQDVIQIIQDATKILLAKRQNKITILNISEDYHNFMKIILDLGITYSSFIENVFTNMYINNNIPIRYLLKDNPMVMATRKLGHKKLHSIISKLLGLLYEPNSASISAYNDEDNKLITESDTIFEKLWKGTF